MPKGRKLSDVISEESLISKRSTNELLNELNKDSSMAVLEVEENFDSVI